MAPHRQIEDIDFNIGLSVPSTVYVVKKLPF